MKILATGGAGFIGYAVIRHIITNTQDLVVNSAFSKYLETAKLISFK